MKTYLIIFSILFTFSTKGQEYIEYEFEIHNIDTLDPFYYFYNIDTISIPKENLLVVRNIWIEKTDSTKFKQLTVGNSIYVRTISYGPEKSIDNGDTLNFRGHGNRHIYYIEGQSSTPNNKKSKNSNKTTQLIRVENYLLIEIIKNGN